MRHSVIHMRQGGFETLTSAARRRSPTRTTQVIFKNQYRRLAQSERTQPQLEKIS